MFTALQHVHRLPAEYMDGPLVHLLHRCVPMLRFRLPQMNCHWIYQWNNLIHSEVIRKHIRAATEYSVTCHGVLKAQDPKYRNDLHCFWSHMIYHIPGHHCIYTLRKERAVVQCEPRWTFVSACAWQRTEQRNKLNCQMQTCCHFFLTSVETNVS